MGFFGLVQFVFLSIKKNQPNTFDSTLSFLLKHGAVTRTRDRLLDTCKAEV